MDIDSRLEAQAERNRQVTLDPRAVRVRDLVTEIAEASEANLKIYDNAVNLQKLEIERSGLIGEMRGEIRVAVDNSAFF